MSRMFAEIKRIVDEDISNRITQFDVIFEAITNAIHANATTIDCYLNSNDHLLNDEEGNEIAKKKVDSIKVVDNGDGMNNDNYDSFCKYRSEYKKDLGCKGVGRFVFLKVYNDALFKSLLVKEQEERTFKFNAEFDTDNLEKISKEAASNQTEIFLNEVSLSYLNPQKHIDRRIDLDLDTIKEKVLVNLIPTLFFYKKKEVTIVINFIDETNGDKKSISAADIPDFIEKSFEIKDNRSGKAFTFMLHYKIEEAEGKLYSFYCANNRTVAEFADKDFKLSLPYNYSGFMLLESSYLNERVNNERNEFTIYPVRTDAFSTLSWEIINEQLKKVVAEIVKDIIPETVKKNKEKLEEIQDERPYLTNYIEEGDIDIAGFMDKKQIIERAKKRFDAVKENVLTSIGKDNYTDWELREAIELAQNELISYINDRVQVIERLKKLISKKERVESVIHNLFMTKQTDDNYFSLGKNNLWLLDDRFTTYSYAASDKRIKEVLKQIGEEEGDTEILNDKPDLSIFFSHNPENTQRLKSVLVEIKPFDFQSKSDRKKFAGIQQLVDYVKAFKSKESIDEIFAFLITDVDEKLATRLKQDDYTPLFSLETPIFHRFYNQLGISIYVISAMTLVKDAEARNKVFLDIIRKQSRLKKILLKEETNNNNVI